MATDFFERQSAARKSTKWLVMMFSLGVLGIVGGITALTWYALDELPLVNTEVSSQLWGQPQEHVTIPVLAGLAALVLIGGGTWYKLAQLRGGGTVVAESLGGTRVYPNVEGFAERRLLNVVEEMALASGVPVPPVYILEGERGINAFAAGYAPSDAVVAVTRGCAETLSREELQGVVAHEFSHILNGDMRLNIRLIGVLHGLLLLGLIGRILLRSGAGSSRRSSRDNNGSALLMIGLAMLILGYVGTLMGSLIKAAVSRQREYLADASAVQFTRNPGGLSGALKKIGGFISGSKLESANASEASHMFFAQGVWEGFTSLTATHPPLKKRILALEPNWNGKFPAITKAAASRFGSEAVSGLAGDEHVELSDADDKVPLAVVEHAAEQVGEPTELHRTYAAELVSELPPAVLESIHEPYGSRAVVYCLLMDREASVRQNQFAALEKHAAKDVFQLTRKLLPTIDQLDASVRLPMVDIALASLRAMSDSQYRTFIRCFKELVEADQQLALFEWTLYQIVLRHLRPQYEKTAAPAIAYYGLQRMGGACSMLLSTLAYADNRRAEAPAAFARGAERLPNVNVELLTPEACGLKGLNESLEQLTRVASKQRKFVVEACAACICADHDVTVAEAELFRGICDMLDCPMPPLLPGQNVRVMNDER
ncbi:MAG: M48 family metallopeptidase [Lacipirellulaceae bacterium]